MIVCDTLLAQIQPVGERCIAYPVAAWGALPEQLPLGWDWDGDDPARLQAMQCIQTTTAGCPGHAAPALSFHRIIDSVRGEKPISRALIIWAICGLGWAPSQHPSSHSLPYPVRAHALPSTALPSPQLCPPQPPSENVAVTVAGPQVQLALTPRRSLPASPLTRLWHVLCRNAGTSHHLTSTRRITSARRSTRNRSNTRPYASPCHS
ncbi:hypothetical protein PSPO01_05322 [Paraphaeosphaeria sporulosa]